MVKIEICDKCENKSVLLNISNRLFNCSNLYDFIIRFINVFTTNVKNIYYTTFIELY